MPRGGANRLPPAVPKEYFELRRGGLKGTAAARRVGVSTSAGSLWFIKAGRMLLPDRPIDDRYPCPGHVPGVAMRASCRALGHPGALLRCAGRPGP